MRDNATTGGGRGLGRAFASLGGKRRRRCYPKLMAGARTAAKITDAAGRAYAVETDVSDEASVAAMVATTVAKFGGIDILVNNAALLGTLTSHSETGLMNLKQRFA